MKMIWCEDTIVENFMDELVYKHYEEFKEFLEAHIGCSLFAEGAIYDYTDSLLKEVGRNIVNTERSVLSHMLWEHYGFSTVRKMYLGFIACVYFLEKFHFVAFDVSCLGLGATSPSEQYNSLGLVWARYESPPFMLIKG